MSDSARSTPSRKPILVAVFPSRLCHCCKVQARPELVGSVSDRPSAHTPLTSWPSTTRSSPIRTAQRAARRRSSCGAAGAPPLTRRPDG
jgi:hypothetical protein